MRDELTRTAPGHATLVQAFATGIKNYSTATLVFDRTAAGVTHRMHAWAEHFPAGWRFVSVGD